MYLVAKVCFRDTYGDQLCLSQSNLTTEQLKREVRLSEKSTMPTNNIARNKLCLF